jgi:hypothetical protein
MNQQNQILQLIKVVAIICAMLAVVGCSGHLNSWPVHSIAPGSVSTFTIDNEKWSRRAVVDGRFSFIYEIAGSKISIGVTRWSERSLPPRSSNDQILKWELGSLHRYDDSTVKVKETDRMRTSFGDIPRYHLTSTDPLWRLRYLLFYQDNNGDIEDIGFYSEDPTIEASVVRSYLERMHRAKLITHEIQRG